MSLQIRRALLSAALMIATGAWAAAAGLSGDEILRRMDANTAYRTIQYDGTLAIYSGTVVRTKEMKATAMGTTRALAEFTNPEDKGTKFLKIDKNLWIYFPSEQDTVKISGHMLKEGMMGSDVSYQDALESDDLFKKYAVTVSGEDSVDGRPCYVLTLSATAKDVQYETRKMWVDKERFVALRQEMYAKSGKLLKVSTVLDVQQIGDRWFPVKEEISDQLKQGSRTQFIMKDIRFDVPVDESLFSLRNLQR
ncbi:MAG TPA: outer membrane lipoprotein-sorting protein [Spirochaetia bacterium]|nr:outer membrane lipoprotein-sorting protein [Spirochaetia bacterium]